jgi:hypothetical protein
MFLHIPMVRNYNGTYTTFTYQNCITFSALYFHPVHPVVSESLSPAAPKSTGPAIV